MVHIDEHTIDHLAHLARIACTKEQRKALYHDLQRILQYMDQLNECNTDTTPPCTYVTECLNATPLRADLPANTLSREAFLANAPQHIGGMVRVPPVLKPES